VVFERHRRLHDRIRDATRVVVVLHELLMDLEPHGLELADVAVEFASLDARHPLGEAAEVADEVPHFVGGLRDLHFRFAVGHLGQLPVARC
jgi:hypothetical protein